MEIFNKAFLSFFISLLKNSEHGSNVLDELGSSWLAMVVLSLQALLLESRTSYSFAWFQDKPGVSVIYYLWPSVKYFMLFELIFLFELEESSIITWPLK